jgi:hypothetical protein
MQNFTLSLFFPKCSDMHKGTGGPPNFLILVNLGAWEVVMRKALAGYIVLIAVATSNQALAQNAGDVFNMFNNIMRAGIADRARTEWSKLPQNESSCIDAALQQQGYSIGTLIQSGIAPNDPRCPVFAPAVGPRRHRFLHPMTP